MIAVEIYGVGADALLALLFWTLRRVPAFAAGGVAVLVMFAIGGYGQASDHLPEWLLMTAGLAATFVGLLIVRVMLIRSVSLHLLGRVAGLQTAGYAEDIRARVEDLRTARLSRRAEGRIALTAAGRAAAALMVILYRVLRIEP
jgi:hypothetical protein